MEQKTKKCPYCGEEIPEDAMKCRYCAEWLEAPSVSKVERSFPSQVSSNAHENKSLKETEVQSSGIKENRFQRSLFNKCFIHGIKHCIDFKGMSSFKELIFSVLYMLLLIFYNYLIRDLLFYYRERIQKVWEWIDWIFFGLVIAACVVRIIRWKKANKLNGKKTPIESSTARFNVFDIVFLCVPVGIILDVLSFILLFDLW